MLFSNCSVDAVAIFTKLIMRNFQSTYDDIHLTTYMIKLLLKYLFSYICISSNLDIYNLTLMPCYLCLLDMRLYLEVVSSNGIEYM